jgi:hypothetical protein
VLALKVKERLRPRADDPTTNLTHPVPAPLNELLCRIFASERYLLRRWSLPFGHSIFVLAAKLDDRLGPEHRWRRAGIGTLSSEV